MDKSLKLKLKDACVCLMFLYVYVWMLEICSIFLPPNSIGKINL